MPELPKLSGKDIIKILGLLGFNKVRQKGSHVVLRKEHCGCVIPLHREVAVGTLRSALKQANISLEDFFKAYKGG